MQSDHSDRESDDRKPPRFDINDYRETSFVLLAKVIAADPKVYVPGQVLAAALRANRGKPAPDAVLDCICLHLEGKARKPAGRKSADNFRQIVESVAASKYRRYFEWLQRRHKAQGSLEGWSCIRGADWWKGAPGERAARMVKKRFFRSTNVRHVQNLISKERSSK